MLFWNQTLATLLACIYLSTVCSIENCEKQCLHGTCVDEASVGLSNAVGSLNKTPKVICVCDETWSGPACDVYNCQGRTSLTSAEGIISDGTNNYTTDNKCTWLIEGTVNIPLRLRFEEFVTECSWDHLYIFDGSSIYDPLIAVYSGIILASGSSVKMFELTANSGSAYLYFYSDAAVSMAGFTIRYWQSLCANNCSNRGSCTENGTCLCSDGWTGEECQVQSCPNNCSYPNGSCGPNKVCTCQLESHGYDCSVPSSKGAWSEIVQVSGGYNPPASASHSAVLVKNQLWIMCGYNFKNTTNCSSPARFNFIDPKKWEEVETKGAMPASRYGHTATSCQNMMIYMYGGVVDGVVSSELWQYNTTMNKWKQLSLITKGMSPYAVAGHSAHCVNFGGTGVLLVFFGHNPILGYLNSIQRYDIALRTWSIVNTTGALVKGRYGHSSVYDESTGLILVHGGYHSQSFSAYSLSDALYAFNPNTSAWLVLRSSQQPRYLHSAVLIGRLMLVFGGNTHNDTSVSHGAKCYSSFFMAYDIDCDTWYTLNEPNLPRSIARFGHTATAYQEKMYIFGGFGGTVLNDMLIYEPGECKSQSSSTCLTSREGTKCVWANNAMCLTPSDGHARLLNKNIMDVKSGPCASIKAVNDCGEKDRYRTCLSCAVNSQGCEWCSATECLSPGLCDQQQKSTNETSCLAIFPQSSLACVNYHNCQACSTDSRCVWNTRDNRCDAAVRSSMTTAAAIVSPSSSCSPPCDAYTTCENCTQAMCMWCSSWPPKCIESNSYVVSFPFGQCMEWTTMQSKCAATRCGDLKTCGDCLENPACGWCDDGSSTGLGTCMNGGKRGAIDSNTSLVDTSACPSDLWFFTSGPTCQCNGHSTCVSNTSQCVQCEDFTKGDNCEQCEDGYWGQPQGGGNCTECECNGQADLCNQSTSACYCNTRGVIGDRCTECDKVHKYLGDPKNGGTCYYELTIDYIFTFNLSYEDNKYYTRINFLNMPPSEDKDVEFNINCTGEAMMNMTVKSANDVEERFIVSQETCTVISFKLSHKDYKFGSRYNTTFYVYLYDFRAPFLLQLYFSQNDHLDLFRFFITFFSCFFSLLLVAFIAWKLKQRYDVYRRSQRHIQEMAAMASRPFGTCQIEVTRSAGSAFVPQERADVRASSRRKKECKCSPITLQPLAGHKAAVLTVLIRLPSGDEDYTLPDQCGMAIGSALITVGGYSKRASLELNKSERSSKRFKAPSQSAAVSLACLPQPSNTAAATVAPSQQIQFLTAPTVTVSSTTNSGDVLTVVGPGSRSGRTETNEFV